jgi:hypothetical protein
VSLGALLDQPYDSSISSSSEVPGRYFVAIAGRPYQIDIEKYSRMTNNVIRIQQDPSPEPGEQTIDVNDLWRRSQSDWSAGAGQTLLDPLNQYQARFEPLITIPIGSRYRFRSSKGVNVFDTQGQFSLLNDTTIAVTHTGTTTLKAITVGTRLYLANNQTLSFTTNGTAFTTVTGTPAGQQITDICSDGFNVYIAYGSVNLIYATNTGTTVAAIWDSGAGATGFKATLLAYVKNRLIAAGGTNPSDLYNLTTSAARTNLTPLFIPASWTWDAISEHATHILVAGHSGDQSIIWAIGIQPESTNLTQPVVSIGSPSIPSGETVTSLGFYLGYVAVGTSKGIRLGSPTAAAITIGPRIDTPSPVQCVHPQGNGFFFGWTAYDTVSSGVGRLDLRTFTLGNRPAFASDLMVGTVASPAQGNVTSICTFLGYRWFTVQGTGLVNENTGSLVASGTLNTGQMVFGLSDPKIFRYLLMRHQPLPVGASVNVSSALDSGTPSAPLVSNQAGSTVPPGGQLSLGSINGYRMELQWTLNRGTVVTTGPAVTQWTVRAWPIPYRSDVFTIPIILEEHVIDMSGDAEAFWSVLTEFNNLKALERAGLPVTYQEGSQSFEVFLDQVDLPAGLIRYTEDRQRLQGTCVVIARKFQ